MARQPIIPVRADAETKERWAAAAAAAGLSLSEWMRDTLNVASGGAPVPVGTGRYQPVPRAARDLDRRDVEPDFKTEAAPKKGRR